MCGAVFMTDVSCESALSDETSDESFDGSHVPAAVVADVDDEPIAGFEVVKDVVEVGFTDAI